MLLHQLIMTLRLSLLKLQTEKKKKQTVKESYEVFHDAERRRDGGDRNIKFSSSSLQCSVYKKKKRNIKKSVCCFNPDSPSSAHPFYVLDDFVDVGLIDLDLLPGNTQSDRMSLSETSLSSDMTSWMDQCMKQMEELQQASPVRCSGLIPACVCMCVCVNGSYSSARCFSLVFAWLIFSVLLRSICLFSSFFSLQQQQKKNRENERSCLKCSVCCLQRFNLQKTQHHQVSELIFNYQKRSNNIEQI